MYKVYIILKLYTGLKLSTQIFSLHSTITKIPPREKEIRNKRALMVGIHTPLNLPNVSCIEPQS
jgi:hypothetical protein